MTASAPCFATFCAIATLAITGRILIPASFKASIYLPGLPAPVATTAGFSSMTTCITSSANGDISITFTPKGLSVSSRHFLICALTTSAGAPPAAINPKPPPFDTAAASSAVATHAIPP